MVRLISAVVAVLLLGCRQESPDPPATESKNPARSVESSAAERTSIREDSARIEIVRRLSCSDADAAPPSSLSALAKLGESFGEEPAHVKAKLGAPDRTEIVLLDNKYVAAKDTLRTLRFAQGDFAFLHTGSGRVFLRSVELTSHSGDMPAGIRFGHSFSADTNWSCSLHAKTASGDTVTLTYFWPDAHIDHLVSLETVSGILRTIRWEFSLD